MSSPSLDLASCLHTAPTAERFPKRLRVSRRGLNLPKLVGPATVNPTNFMRSHQHGTRRSRLARRTSTGAFLKREPSSVLSEGCPCDSMIGKMPSRKSDGRARPDAKRRRLDRTGPCVQSALDIAREQNNLIISDMVLNFHAFVSQMFDAEEKKPGSTSRWDFLN
jgi:hypothetical protein